MYVMNLKSIVNNARRAVMNALTSFAGTSDVQVNREIRAAGLERVLLCRPNGRLGNQLMITPIVQEITRRFPGCRIDLFVKGSHSEAIFKNYEQVDRIIKLPRRPFGEPVQYIKVWLSLRKRRYDLAFNVADGSSSGRLSTRFARARWRFYNNAEDVSVIHFPDYRHMALSPVYRFRRYLVCPFPDLMRISAPSLSLRLSVDELADGRKTLHSYVSSAKETICIYTFATGAKRYSETWWTGMYARLKEAFADAFNILEILPVENVSAIGFEAPAYYSRDIRQIASVIANSAVFLGADSGMMHLAAASGAPTVGLFSVTNPVTYRPCGGCNLAVDTLRTSPGGIIAELNKVFNYKANRAVCQLT